MKKFINVLLVVMFFFALVPLASVHADGPELTEVNKSYFVGESGKSFSGLTQSLKAITKNGGDTGYILRESLFESKGQKVEYEKYCAWNFSFQVYASRGPRPGEIKAGDCIRFHFVNLSNEPITFQIVLTRAFVTKAEQERAGIKADPYDVSATDPQDKKIKALGWFFGSSTGTTVLYQNTGDSSLDGSVYIEGSYVASGGNATNVIKDKKVVFDAGEWATTDSDAAITTGDAPSPSVFAAPFRKDQMGSTVLTFTLDPEGEATVWQGIRIAADTDPQPTPTVVPSIATPMPTGKKV